MSGGLVSGALPGFEVPLHRSLTEPILMGGAPRTVAITNGTLSQVAVVWAVTEDGVRGFLVERGQKGFEARDIKGKFSLRGSVTSDDNCCRFHSCSSQGEAINEIGISSDIRVPRRSPAASSGRSGRLLPDSRR